MAGSAAVGLPDRALWLPQLRAVLCLTCQALVGSKGMIDERDLVAYSNTIYYHFRQKKLGHTASTLKPIMNALESLLRSAKRDHPQVRLFMPSHVAQIALPELPVYVGYYCPAANGPEKCTFVTRSAPILQNHLGSSKHGTKRDINACTCTLQSGFSKCTVRVIRPYAAPLEISSQTTSPTITTPNDTTTPIPPPTTTTAITPTFEASPNELPPQLSNPSGTLRNDEDTTVR